MAFRKYAKKFAKKGARFAKKRYTTRTGGVKLNQVAKDVYTIKRSLNVEHKHLDYKIGSAGSSSIVAQRPTKATPLIIALNTPVRGTSYNNRVGNQIRVTHMTAKYQFTYHNNSDLTQRQTVRARIIFARNADHVPLIANLLDTDGNGHYTDQSFINTQEYKKFLWIKALDTRSSHLQPTNRFPPSNGAGDTRIPSSSSDPDPVPIQVENIGDQELNIADYFKRAEAKTSVRMMFANGTDTVEQMKPYLMLTSDVIEAAGDDYDFISVSGVIRMTYVDN